MTEDEAKTKWCPMVRFTRLNDYERDSNRDTDVKVVTCIGSKCMAWREDLTREEAQSGFVAKNGHCGLAK